MTEKFVMQPPTLMKADTEDSDGVLTPFGMEVAHRYASAWDGGHRAASMETKHPELVGLFYDIRHDRELATQHATPFDKSLTAEPRFVLPLAKAQQVIDIGPRGGRIVAYVKGKPIYEGTPAAKKMGQSKKKTKAAPKKVESEGPKREWTDFYRDKSYGEFHKWEDGKLVKNAKDERGGIVGTQLDHTNPDGTYSKERNKLHNEWVDSFFVDKSGKRVTPPAKGEEKVAIVMMGGPASGKTSALKHLLNKSDGDFAALGYVNVNPDDVKEKMPEYNHGIFGGSLSDYVEGGKYAGMSADEVGKAKEADGTLSMKSVKNTAWIAHEESSDVAGMVKARALDSGMNVIIDGTGKSIDKHVRAMDDLRAKGYRVQLVMSHIDMDVAEQRSIERADRSGRWVPIEDVFRPAHRQIPGNFEQAAAAADGFTLFDTDVPWGDPPTMRWQGSRNQPEDVIPDAGWIKEFKATGRRLHEEHARIEGMKKSEGSDPLFKGEVESSKSADKFREMALKVKNNKPLTYDEAWGSHHGAVDFEASDLDGRVDRRPKK